MESAADPLLKIKGGSSLDGSVMLPGAKNAALPSLVAACLATGETVLRNVPLALRDVRILIQLLRSLGATIEVQRDETTVVCSGENWEGGEVPGRAGELRHSLLLLGAGAHFRTPLSLPMPGGCKLGRRKHDLHVLALRELGFEVHEREESIDVAPESPTGRSEIRFHYPTFGGTINVLLASARREGVTLLHNPARNPEVLNVIELLKSMGANISWPERRLLRIEGVDHLRSTEHAVMSDRIVAATLMAAASTTRGRVFIEEGSLEYLSDEAQAWRRAGLKIEEDEQGILVEGSNETNPVDVRTTAYPGFHTDIQPLHAAIMVFSSGRSTIEETILDGRFRYAQELNKMGADLAVAEGNFTCVNGAPGEVLHISGVDALRGAEVVAPDIRGGAALVTAALAAEGVSYVSNIRQLERGYGRIEDLLSPLGADIQRADATELTNDPVRA